MTNKEKRYKGVYKTLFAAGVQFQLYFFRSDTMHHPRLGKERRATMCQADFQLTGAPLSRVFTTFLRPGERFDEVKGRTEAVRKLVKFVGATDKKTAQALWDAWLVEAKLVKAKKQAGKAENAVGTPSVLDRQVATLKREQIQPGTLTTTAA
jgi:hypothetical protein